MSQRMDLEIRSINRETDVIHHFLPTNQNHRVQKIHHHSTTNQAKPIHSADQRPPFHPVRLKNRPRLESEIVERNHLIWVQSIMNGVRMGCQLANHTPTSPKQNQKLKLKPKKLQKKPKYEPKKSAKD